VPLLLRYPESSRFFMVCSDDMQAKELVEEGHIDHKLRVAIDAGLDPITAIQLATINPAEYFGLAASLGSIAPGKLADLLLIDSLGELRPQTVIAAGRVVAREGRATGGRSGRTPPPESLKAGVELPRPLVGEDFRIAAAGPGATAKVRVIGIENGTLLSKALVHELPVGDGVIANDVEHDVLKVAALDRHRASGRIGLAFLTGTGLERGAIATTFTAPHYGLLVVGTSDEEMAFAVGAMRDLGGGLVAVQGGTLVASVEFEVGGVVGSLPLEEMHAELRAFEDAAAGLGSTLTDHLTALAAVTIPHIPQCGLSDLGLYDLESGRFVDILAEG
jgi:adenine deaminase